MASYKKIAELLKEHLRCGEYPDGKYPPLRKIAADMGCSYVTAVHAMNFLKEQKDTPAGHAAPIVAMISGHWRFTPWHKAVRESVMELGGLVRFISYSSFIDPIITTSLNEKFDLIIVDCPVEPKTPLFKVIWKNRDHVIVLSQRELADSGIRCLCGAPEKTIVMIMKDLAKHGIRHIDMIGRASDKGPALRQETWEQGLQLINGHGRFYGYPHVSFQEESVEAYLYIKERIKKIPEALFCQSQPCAQGVYHFLYEKGLIPGKDISVFSFGEPELSKMMNPPLATVLDAGMKKMVKKVIAEYTGNKLSSTMIFELTEMKYDKGKSLMSQVP